MGRADLNLDLADYLQSYTLLLACSPRDLFFKVNRKFAMNLSYETAARPARTGY